MLWRARVAALAVFVALGLPAAAADAQSSKVGVQRMGFHERGKHITLSTSVTNIFNTKSYKKLSSGFVSTLVYRIYVYKKGSELPVGFTLVRARIVYDLWDEVYVVRIDGPAGRSNKRFKHRSDALRAISELRRLPVALLSNIPRGPHFFVGMVVELNPVSRALLAEVRRWLTRKPGKTTLDRTSSFFGSFVSVFVNPKLPEADRVLRLRSQPFYRVKAGKKKMSSQPRRRSYLQLKLVFGLLFISVVPLIVSGFLIDPITDSAKNFVANHTAKVRTHLENSHKAQLALARTQKTLFRQIAIRFSTDARLQEAANSDDLARIATELDRLIAEEVEVTHVSVRPTDGKPLVVRERATPDKPVGEWRRMPMTVALTKRHEVRLVFLGSEKLLRDIKALGEVIKDERGVDSVRAELPSSFRTSFLLLFGGVVVLVTAIGLFLARGLTRRIDLLVTGTREVAAGNLEARVDMSGRDELTELAEAFNRMVDDLNHDREHIAYLQRVGAWQDVARKLAHEIKNPLTPIQLAMQQCVSSYDGQDERFSKLLADADEIVGEEIANLRRLVDAFRTLGKLPRVEPEPLDLGGIVADIEKDPQWSGLVEVDDSSDATQIRGDKLLLRRVLSNLVENGIQSGKAAGTQGRVKVSWRVEGELARVYVDDQGPGVAADRRQSIFEPYFTSKEEGTGLGLTISKKIAIEHRGSLEVAAAPSPLGGARFVLSIPTG